MPLLRGSRRFMMRVSKGFPLRWNSARGQIVQDPRKRASVALRD